jgi:hypothetical protein
MESSLSATEKEAVEQRKAASRQIDWHSRELGRLVDIVPANVKTPKLPIESRDLVKEAREIVQAGATAPVR